MVHTVLSHSLLRMSHVWPYPKFAQYLAHRYLSHMDVDVDVGTDSTGSCHSTAANASGCSALHRKMKKILDPQWVYTSCQPWSITIIFTMTFTITFTTITTCYYLLVLDGIIIIDISTSKFFLGGSMPFMKIYTYIYIYIFYSIAPNRPCNHGWSTNPLPLTYPRNEIRVL